MPKIEETFDGIVKRVVTPAMFIYNNELIYAIALWDTGANATVISQELVNTLHLVPQRKVKANGALGESQFVDEYKINIFLSSEMGFCDLPVAVSDIGKNLIGGERIDVLIGMDIIGSGNFTIKNIDGNTMFTFEISDDIYIEI